MPWQPNGTFLRVNPDYSATPQGDLWGQDLESTPSIKIIATRHDFHDQDLGDGIAACVNLDGLNAMRANLNMGSFKIINGNSATDPDDVPNYDQVAGSMSFDDGLRELSLFDRGTGLIDTVTIPSGTGGGGEGTVSSITLGAGLTGAANPITTVGDIALEFLQAGQTYQNGIQAIVIDDYGRVTQVTTGTGAAGDPDQSLTKDQGFTNAVKIGITKTDAGTQEVQINAAFGGASGKAGVMTRDQVDELAATVRLTGDQSIDGVKGFIDQIFANNGMTLDVGLRITNIPTSAPGLSGQIWSNGGVLNIVP